MINLPLTFTLEVKISICLCAVTDLNVKHVYKYIIGIPSVSIWNHISSSGDIADAYGWLKEVIFGSSLLSAVRLVRVMLKAEPSECWILCHDEYPLRVILLQQICISKLNNLYEKLYLDSGNQMLKMFLSAEISSSLSWFDKSQSVESSKR